MALTIKHARNFTLKDVEITWQAPGQDHWTSALLVEDVAGLTLDDLSARQGLSQPQAPAIVLRAVDGAVVQHATPNPALARSCSSKAPRRATSSCGPTTCAPPPRP